MNNVSMQNEEAVRTKSRHQSSRFASSEGASLRAPATLTRTCNSGTSCLRLPKRVSTSLRAVISRGLIRTFVSAFWARSFVAVSSRDLCTLPTNTIAAAPAVAQASATCYSDALATGYPKLLAGICLINIGHEAGSSYAANCPTGARDKNTLPSSRQLWVLGIYCWIHISMH